jgi:hypothetical protein
MLSREGLQQRIGSVESWRTGNGKTDALGCAIRCVTAPSSTRMRLQALMITSTGLGTGTAMQFTSAGADLY